MSLDAIIMLIGALVALVPFLGFPNSWDRIIFLVLGVLIIVLGIVVRRRGTRKDAATETPRTPGEQTVLDLSTHDAPN